MKICIISSLFNPYKRGGAEVVAQNIAEGYVARGHQVFVITLGKQKIFEKQGNLGIYRIKPLNLFSFLEIEYYPTWLRIFWHLFDAFNISGRYQVKKILKKEAPDIVFTHNIKGIGYLLPNLIKKLKIKHCHTIHDVQLSRPSGLIIHGQEKPFLILDKIYEKICLNLFTSPNYLISPSRWLLDYYTTRGFFYKSKKAVIQNPVSRLDFGEKSDTVGTLSMVRFLYLGQLEITKGIFFLIETLKNLKIENWELKIVGGGSQENQVKEAIKNNNHFKFYGFIKHSQLNNIFRNTDFTIVPSLCYENSPTVIYESLSLGIPVIASDIGGIGELVKDNYNGFTFEPASFENLSQIIKYFVSHPEITPNLKKNAIDSVANFTLEKYMDKILSFVSGN